MRIIQVKYCDIPAYLQCGSYYRDLNEIDPEVTIDVPADSFTVHPPLEVPQVPAANLNDFCQLLRTTLFWGLDVVPACILQFCRLNVISVWRDEVMSISNPSESNIVKALLLVYGSEGEVPFMDVIKTKQWEIIMDVVSRLDKNGSATAHAAYIGNLAVLKLLREKEFVWDSDTCFVATMNGHLNCLQYAHEHGCPWDFKVKLWAAKYGHLACLQYAHAQGLEWHDEVCAYAAQGGHLDCLQYAHVHGADLNVGVYVAAAGYGQLACMQYAHAHGVPWHYSVCYWAAGCGHLDCLQFAHEHGCEWDEETVLAAAQNGHFECLQYALQQSCPIEERALEVARENGHLDCQQLLETYKPVH